MTTGPAWGAGLVITDETVERGGGKEAVVTLQGELDVATAPLLVERLDVLLTGVDRVVFDLAGLGFIDCAGIEPIVHAARVVGQHAGVEVRSPSPLTRRVLEILELDQVLELQPHEAAGRAGLIPEASGRFPSPPDPAGPRAPRSTGSGAVGLRPGSSNASPRKGIASGPEAPAERQGELSNPSP